MYPNYLGYEALPIFHGLAFLFFLPVLILLAVWIVVIKGFALWHAARNKQTLWFIVLLIVNTLGFLEVLYLIFWRKDQNSAVAAASSTV